MNANQTQRKAGSKVTNHGRRSRGKNRGAAPVKDGSVVKVDGTINVLRRDGWEEGVNVTACMDGGIFASCDTDGTCSVYQSVKVTAYVSKKIATISGDEINPEKVKASARSYLEKNGYKPKKFVADFAKRNVGRRGTGAKAICSSEDISGILGLRSLKAPKAKMVQNFVAPLIIEEIDGSEPDSLSVLIGDAKIR